MKKSGTSIRKQVSRSILFFTAVASGLLCANVSAQAPNGDANGFRIGERLTYNVSVGRYRNAASAELYTVSRGRIGDKDAIELRAKFKTLNVASAATYLVDQTRTTFASPITALPLYTTLVEGTYGIPKETNQSYLAVATPHTDLLTMIHWLRRRGGNGSVTMQENGKVYTVTFQVVEAEKQQTDAGEFDTSVVAVQSDYFTECGMTDVRVALSKDEASVPVTVRFRTPKGEFRAELASIQTIEPEVAPQPTPTPAPIAERTPKPVVTPTPHIDNQPLHPELAFVLGEKLQYKITAGGSQVATMTLFARERKLVDGLDTLVLEAYFADVRSGSPFANGDTVRANVNPETLAPRRIDIRFSGGLNTLSSTARFEQEGSSITYGGANRVSAPVGTHSILSLVYAARSFNLKPSRNASNPINDTRVAVFWETQPYVFTLRPALPEVIMMDGKPIGAQLVTVSTGNPRLDQLGIKVWLGTDDSRTPLRFMIGGYQADLIKSEKPAPQ